MPDRCRLCTSNDREALRESVAADLWESRRDKVMGDPSWEDASVYWRDIYVGFAETALQSIERGRG